jgi:hypothetical protein
MTEQERAVLEAGAPSRVVFSPRNRVCSGDMIHDVQAVAVTERRSLARLVSIRITTSAPGRRPAPQGHFALSPLLNQGDTATSQPLPR